MRRWLLLLLLCPAMAGAQDFIRYYPPASSGSGGEGLLDGTLCTDSDGFLVRTSSGNCTIREMAAGAGIAIANPAGTAGNPSFSADTAVIPQFSSGTGSASATGSVGTWYYETDAGLVSTYSATDTLATMITAQQDSIANADWFIDEDSFATDSATRVPSQQSVKAYVDAEVAGASGVTFVVKTADESITSDDTYSNDATLTFSVLANTQYWFSISGWYTTHATPDFKFQVTCPASPTTVTINRHYENGAGTTTAVNGDLACSQSTAVTSASATSGSFRVVGLLRNGANAGSVTLQWAQATNDGNTTTVKAGSFLMYQVVP